MTHEEVVEFFLYNNVNVDTPVTIAHKNGNQVNARIADSYVHYDYDEFGNIINSRIKIIAPKPQPGYYVNPNPVILMSDEIQCIKRILSE